MKSTTLFISALVLSVAILTSCGSSNDKMIVGVWKISDMKIEGLDLSSLPEEAKAKVAKQMQEAKDSSSFEAKSDGTYINVSWTGEKRENKGTWKFSSDGKKLILLDGPRMDTVDVTITDKSMVWNIKGGSTISYTK